ncbi:MAG: hypothetical protein GTO30_08600, partial [Acidobacteria bacterium]|nr:hypothetical protein [Acidobacteriota bacterium]NIQ86929.1 hypothetical protein [Acidobacteriota bacterium]
MWEVALELGRPEAASRAMLRVISDEVRRNAPSAVDHWLDLASRGLHGDAPPALLIHVALMLSEADQRTEALSALQRAMEISTETDSPEIAARVARASRALDRGFTEMAAWAALGSTDLSYQDRQNLEALLGELYRESPLSPLPDVPQPVRADTEAVPSVAERAVADDRPADPLLHWEDPELPDETGLSREEPLTPVAASDESESAETSIASVRPAPIDLEITSRELRVVNAQPGEMVEDGLVIEIDGGDKRKIGFDRIDAISVVAVEGLAAKFVIVIDLALNWMSDSSEPLKVIRLRGDRFDPRTLAPGK